MRKDLSIDQLGDLLERPFNAVLATYRRDGSVLRTWDFADDAGLS